MSRHIILGAVPRRAKTHRTPLGRDLQKRARYGPVWLRLSAEALSLLVVTDPAGGSITNRIESFETVLKQAVRAMGESDWDTTEELSDRDFERRSRVAVALFQLHPRWANKDLSPRRREICQSIFKGTLTPDGLRARYEIETYEFLAAIIRGLDRQYRHRAGRTDEGSEQEDIARITRELLAPLFVPVGNLVLSLDLYLGALPVLRELEESPPDFDEDVFLAKLAEDVEADAFYGFTVGEIEERYAEWMNLMTVGDAVELAFDYLVHGLWSYALVLSKLEDVYFQLRAWEGPGAHMARSAALEIDYIARMPLRFGSWASRLRHLAQSGEPAPLYDFLQTDQGQSLLKYWKRWLDGCRCAGEEGREFRGACQPHEMRAAAGRLLVLIDAPHLPAAVRQQFERQVRPVTLAERQLQKFYEEVDLSE